MFSLLSIVFLVLSLCDDAVEMKEELHIATLLPYSGSFINGQPCSAIYQMAIDDMERENVLPDHRLVLHVRDTECSPGMAVFQMHDLLFTPPTKLVLLGPICSDCCVATAEAAVHWNISQTTSGCGTPVLSDQEKFPLYMRVNTVDMQANVLRIRTLREYNWRKFAIIHTPQDLFNNVVIDLIKQAKAANMTVLTSETLTGDFNFTLERIRKSEARIIFLFSYVPEAIGLFCAAYRTGLYGSRYVYIVPGWWGADDFNKPPEAVDCSNEVVQHVMRYTLAIGASFDNPHMEEITEYGFTAASVIERYNALAITVGSTVTNLNCYDVIWTIAYGIRNAMDVMRQDNWTRTIDNFTYSDLEMSELLWSEMTKLSYVGVRGPVSFADNGDSLGLFKLDQYKATAGIMGLVELANYNPMTESGNQLVFSSQNDAEWSAGRPPKDSIVSTRNVLRVGIAEYSCLSALAILGLFLTAFFMAFNVYHRQKRFIKMSSPNLNNIALVGCALMYLSVFFADLGPTHQHDGTRDTTIQLVFCKIRSIVASVGFSVAFGALFSKTYRVHRIFLNKKLQRRVVKDTQLLAMVAVIVLMDAVIFILWEILDSRSAIIESIEERKTRDKALKNALDSKECERSYFPQVVDEDTVEIIEITTCDSRYSMYFMAVLYGIKGILLIFGAFLSWETRKVNVPELNDSKNIGLCIYNVIVVSLLAVGMSLALENSPQLAYLIGSLCTIFATTFTTCMIFVPKMLGIIGGKIGAEELSEGTIGTIHTPVQESSTSTSAA